jgi:predicted  nucleic acid-binding Zn-ribbon protein
MKNQDIPLHKHERIQAELDRTRKELQQSRADCAKLVDELNRANQDFCRKSIEAEHLRAWGSRRDEEMQHQAKLAMESRAECDDLKSNNRYQKGYGDGYASAVDDMRKKLTELPPIG